MDTGSTTTAWDWLTLLALIIGCFTPFILAWTGRYRGFAVAPLTFYRLSKRNI